MVNRTRNSIFILIVVLSCTLLTAPIPLTKAADITYSVSKEWTQLWINSDTSVGLQYNITMAYLSGSPQGIVTVGMPKSGFRINSVKDLAGNSLSWTDSSGGGSYSIDVQLRTPIIVGNPNTIIVSATLPSSSGMVYPDTTNQGYAALTFATNDYPTSTGSTGSITDLRVLIVLPNGITMNNVTAGQVKYPTGLPFNNVLMQGTNVAVYWNRTNWPIATQFNVGVSFPVKYVTFPGPNLLLIAGIILLIVLIVIIAIILLRRVRKEPYVKPKVAIEALGAARGLTAVEAAVVVGSKPVTVLMMILFGMLKKRFVSVTESTPMIKLEPTNVSIRDPAPPRYYEIDFLRAIESDGALNEMRLARTYIDLRDNVDRKMRGYSRIDTVNYYKSVVTNAWNQVTQAGTPELKGDAIDRNMEWLLMDEKYDSRFRESFPPNIVIIPQPGWWWYWHGPYGPYFPRGPTTSGPTGAPTQAPPIPAQEWANNVVKGLQAATNGIVKNVQDFTNRVVPQSKSQSSAPVQHEANCVCACAHCACACACVGCACACAHGGAR